MPRCVPALRQQAPMACLCQLRAPHTPLFSRADDGFWRTLCGLEPALGITNRWGARSRPPQGHDGQRRGLSARGPGGLARKEGANSHAPPPHTLPVLTLKPSTHAPPSPCPQRSDPEAGTTGFRGDDAAPVPKVGEEAVGGKVRAPGAAGAGACGVCVSPLAHQHMARTLPACPLLEVVACTSHPWSAFT